MYLAGEQTQLPKGRHVFGPPCSKRFKIYKFLHMNIIRRKFATDLV